MTQLSLLHLGEKKLASETSGGGVAVAVAPSASGPGAAQVAAEAKKEEKVEEKEKFNDDMGFSLFDWRVLHRFLNWDILSSGHITGINSYYINHLYNVDDI